MSPTSYRCSTLPLYFSGTTNWWMRLDSNQQRPKATDLQSAGLTNFHYSSLFLTCACVALLTGVEPAFTGLKGRCPMPIRRQQQSWLRRPGSNRRPYPYEGCALPAELLRKIRSLRNTLPGIPQQTNKRALVAPAPGNKPPARARLFTTSKLLKNDDANTGDTKQKAPDLFWVPGLCVETECFVSR